MNSVIVSDYGVMLAKTGERLVIRGPRPRLELIEGGPLRRIIGNCGSDVWHTVVSVSASVYSFFGATQTTAPTGP
jgi:hypothetical protein